jgi:4-hydroxybenzoate polyprenyltransferase
MRIPPLVRILRPALAPTAVADVVAAAAFVGGGSPLRVGLAAAGSACLYMAGMAQNDLCDREVDAEKQPDRPLVFDSGLVRPAIRLTAILFVAGLGLAAAADALWPALAVAVLASAYNLGLKRKFPFDALTMGAARAANLSVGFVAAGAAFGWPLAAYAAAYLVFIAAVTAASRAEDLEPPPTRRLALLLGSFPKLLALGGLALVAGGLRALAFLAPAAVQVGALVAAMRAGDRAGAKRYTLRSLLNIYLVHAAVLWTVPAHAGLFALLLCAAATAILLDLLGPRRR